MDNREKPIIAYFAYPITMAMGLAAHLLLLKLGISLLWATYAPILAGAAVITWLEHGFYYREEWAGKKSDVVEDGLYMVLVQVVLPRLVTTGVILYWSGNFSDRQSPLNHLWPHGWETGFQVILMLLSADFLRYWLHRLSHEWPPLWRLHAVHHSPHKLYWFNVGRFHPIEKCLQMVFDTFPFIFLGVGKEVIALYLVFYSINGFIQHCNIQLKLGPLNYLISGPELHRWHHSRRVKESNQNYGNNLIVWDLVFGTWFLPPSREVGELGLINRNYPLTFWQQLVTPFKEGLDKE